MSTSKLQQYTSEQLYKRFGKYGLVENTRRLEAFCVDIDKGDCVE
jgi:hypothetical protein